MTDKNGTEIKTGNIVEITGAYFKNDNGLYYVECSPGDPGWCGSDYGLRKISKAGKISKAKYNIGFWPIFVTVSDRSKTAEARSWNREHAAIEVKPDLANMSEVTSHFRAKAEELDEDIRRLTRNFGGDHPEATHLRTIKAHYEAVAAAISG